MEESWEEKTERLEREYQARIDRLREELREARDIAGVVATNVREIGEGAMAQLKSENAALTKRVAELEDALSKERDVANIDLQVQLEKHDATIANLQSQLAWTPVSAGLPTEPEETVLVRQRRTGGSIYGLLWNNGTALHAVTEEQPCRLYEYGSPSEAMRDWDEYSRIELPKGGES